MPENKRWNIGDIFKVFLFYFFMMLVGIPVFLRVSKQIFRFDLIEAFGQNTILLSLSLVCKYFDLSLCFLYYSGRIWLACNIIRFYSP